MFPYGSDTRPLTFHDIRHTFQSTLPRGSDAVHTSDNVALCYFNPRSLTRATLTRSLTAAGFQRFQSTLPYGSDPRRGTNRSLAFTFQSTLPYGSDKVANCTPNAVKHFNPRSLAGATIENAERLIEIAISIHAPLRERRQASIPSSTNGAISIHAPLRERPTILRLSPITGYFNPRSLAGATPACLCWRLPAPFQSTLPCGSDRHA